MIMIKTIRYWLGRKQAGDGKVTVLSRITGVYQAHALTSADQVIPAWLVYDSISGKVETVIELVTQGLT